MIKTNTKNPNLIRGDYVKRQWCGVLFITPVHALLLHFIPQEATELRGENVPPAEIARIKKLIPAEVVAEVRFLRKVGAKIYHTTEFSAVDPAEPEEEWSDGVSTPANTSNVAWGKKKLAAGAWMKYSSGWTGDRDETDSTIVIDPAMFPAIAKYLVK